MVGCLYGILDFVFIKSMIWLFRFMINSFKYMGMWVAAIFVGPAKTILRLARSNTSRITGIRQDEVERVVPDIFKVERAKVIAWMVWAGFVWLIPIVGITINLLAQ